MKRAVLLLSIFALFASTAFAQKNKTSTCPADITSLRVTFEDRLGDLYRSDGGGSYTTAKTRGENIDIKFQRANCTYDLTMNLNFSKRTTKLTLGDGGQTRDSEFFNFDRVASVPVTDGSDAFLNWCSKGVAIDSSTGKPVNYPDGTAQDNYAGCGYEFDASGNPIHYVLRSVGIDVGDNQGFRYQYSTIDNGATWAAGTSHIRVYRPSANVWELAPDASTGPWGRHYDRSTGTALGDYSVPFKIRVNRLN